MKTEYLYYFYVASTAQSLSKAAKDLHISQQGLSRIIKLLEKEFDCALFARDDSGPLKLTISGHVLQKHAKEVLSQYQQLERAMRHQGVTNLPEHKKTKICFKMTLNVMHNIYPIVHRALTAAFPTLTISANEVEQQDLIKLLESCDDPGTLFFVSIPDYRLEEVSKDEMVVFRPLIDSELDCIVGKNSSLVSLPSLKMEDMGSFEFVVKKDPGMIALLQRRCTSSFFDEIRYWTSDSKFMEVILLSKDAASFSTSFLGRYPELDEFAHIPLEDTFKTPIGFIGRKNIPRSEEALQVMRFVENFFYMNYPKGMFKDDSLICGRWRPVMPIAHGD